MIYLYTSKIISTEFSCTNIDVAFLRFGGVSVSTETCWMSFDSELYNFQLSFFYGICIPNYYMKDTAAMFIVEQT